PPSAISVSWMVPPLVPLASLSSATAFSPAAPALSAAVTRNTASVAAPIDAILMRLLPARRPDFPISAGNGFTVAGGPYPLSEADQATYGDRGQSPLHIR